MENVKLPTEKAHEPAEEAHQPMCISDSTMSSEEQANKPKKRHATFAESVMSTEKELSQNSSTYKEALSQPAAGISHRQRLTWLQKRRGPGLWVQCDACNSWRHLPHVIDSHQLPPKWYCSMNPDKTVADCSAPEVPLRITDEEDLIHSEYSAGSLVWARLPGWPWWPAMVDDCPDTEQFYWLDGFSDIPTHYNVVFFDASGATRAWISPENLQPYTANKKKFRHLLNSKQYKKRLAKSVQEADKAEKLPLAERLDKFSFINTYKGPIVSPKKVNKRDLERYQNKLKRKYNVEFPVELSSESEDESVQAFRESNKKKNVILIGTPKSKKTKQAKATNKDNGHKTVDSEQAEKITKEKTNDTVGNGMNERSSQSYPEIKHDCDKEPRNISNEFRTPKMLTTEFVKTAAVFSVESVDTTDSMNNEIGSTQSLKLGSEMNGIDNDSSKTYAPEDESDIVVLTQDFQIRAETPGSDDFDF